MNNIKWEDGAVCFANGEQHKYDLNKLENLIIFDDFQLNEIRQGDYIEASEIGTEQKYNNAVEVFELFGFRVCDKGNDFNWFISVGTFKIESLVLTRRNIMGSKCVGSVFQHNRKLSYPQLMVIGKLKLAMNARAKPAPKTATDYLQECMKVQTQRGEQYDSKGTGERSFDAAAKAFNAMTGQNIKGSDVCLMLTCVKAVRQYSDPTRVHEDSLLDLVSYSSLWAEEINKELK